MDEERRAESIGQRPLLLVQSSPSTYELSDTIRRQEGAGTDYRLSLPKLTVSILLQALRARVSSNL